MEKVIRDGKVAVLVSPGWGAGWYSWNSHEELLFHPKVVEMVEKGKAKDITEEWVKEETGFADVYCGGADELQIEWLPEGTAFRIEEFDGNETLRALDDLILIA